MPEIKVAGPESAGFGNPYSHLRTPGEIQGFGAMLTLHPTTLRVLSASENVGTELGTPHTAMLGRALFELIDGDEAIAHIRATIISPEPVFENPMTVTVGGRRFDLIMHSHDRVIFAEFEKLAPGAPTRADMDRLSDDAIMGMMVPSTIEELLEAGPASIRSATDFDRVLLYRFDEAHRGQVVGEARRPGVDSFKGMFFPENDIPPPARQLYTENFCRYIPQIGTPNSRVMPAENPLTNRPLDMAPAVLRAVAPCHIDYLSNMGVTASMSFSIVSEGKLWGLFACHHYSQSQLSFTQRLVCEQIAMMFAAKFTELVNPAAVEEEMQARREAVLRSSPVCKPNPLQQEWSAEAEQALLSLVNAEGASIYLDGQVGEVGTCPDLADLHDFIEKKPDEFDRLLRMYDEGGLFYTSSIASVLPFGDRMREKGSGVMVVPLARDRREFVLWFRPELVVKATWAGNPSETQVKDPNARFTPRKSFAAWKEDIRDRSEPWTELDIANAVALRDHVLTLID
ncbi:MAG: GAF domain-containing protein [Rhodopila sp.]|jgi:light-regulated signal transduction histidine kinase (bacteriophytochrome)